MSETEREDRFIEQFGLFFAGGGVVPRAAGRIFSYLLICDPPHQSAAQLEERLQLSKGTVSGMTRQLIQGGLVELVSIPGARARYYRARTGGWTALYFRHLKTPESVHAMLGEGLALLAGKDPVLKAPLQEMNDLYSFLDEEMPRLLEKWQGDQRKKQSP